jgi:hypothetical protein
MHFRFAAGFAGLLGLLAACGAPSLPPVPHYDAATLAATLFKAVLVAGDSSSAAFDEAVVRLGRDLHARAGLRDADIHRLSARDEVLRDKAVYLASVQGMLETIEDLKAGPGEGCLIFVTAPGEPGKGLSLPRGNGSRFLESERLDRSLALGCGNAPTVVILSGCYTGGYLQPPMTRDNRIILIAARAGSGSSACSVGEALSTFDQCLLDALDGLGVGMSWRDAFTATRACVETRERAQHQVTSEPQSWFGPAVSDMKLPWRRRSG